MQLPQSSTPAFFEQMYLADQDPWRFASDGYELQRYRQTLQALGLDRRFCRALEPGCSVGVLTSQLAPCCERLDAFDFSPTAVAHARQRCHALPNVHLSVESLRPGMAWDRYDLLVFSEVGYYFSAAAWQALVSDITASAQPETTWLLCHWLGHSPDHQISGDEVHTLAESQPGWHLDLAERYPGFRLARLVRTA